MSQIAHQIGPNTPLRLAEAVKIAFPSGGMTVSGLRREIARGRLAVEAIAGKQFTTLANIEEMRRLCRVEAKVPASNLEPLGTTGRARSHIMPRGSFETVPDITPQDALSAKLRRLSKPCRTTSP